jgi:cephalosporin hydroxylase
MIKDILRNLRDRFQSNSQDPARNIGCTEFEVDNWAISKFIIHKLLPIVGPHPYPITELNLMTAAVCRLKPQQVFEWGTNIGKSARIFYEIGKQFGIPLDIHSIDLPDDLEHTEHPKSSRGRMVRGYAGVTLHQGDGLGRSIELYQRHPDRSTLVFIDGDHSYESVYRELNGVIDAMPNAHILLHDTFYQSEASGYNIGPHRAVSETLSTIPGQYQVISTNTGLPGMTLLYKLQAGTALSA